MQNARERMGFRFQICIYCSYFARTSHGSMLAVANTSARTNTVQVPGTVLRVQFNCASYVREYAYDIPQSSLLVPGITVPGTPGVRVLEHTVRVRIWLEGPPSVPKVMLHFTCYLGKVLAFSQNVMLFV